MDLDFGSTFQDILKHLPSLGLDAETPMFSTSFNADSGAAVGCFRVDDLVDPATLAEGRQALDVKFLPQPQPRKILLSKEEVVEWVHSEISGTSGFLAAE